jgi:CubicO group peptidase (beta-lactamase class C family)
MIKIMMKVVFLVFLFLSIETSCKNNTITPVASEPVVAADVAFRSLTSEERSEYINKAQQLYGNFLNGNFNGSILIAKNGEILIEKYKGIANFTTKENINSNTPFHLASVSKTFTAMAILKLWEQGKVSLDDDIRQYIPSLPYYGITLRMLLSHRSGLANYAYFIKTNDKSRIFSNDDVINYMISYQPKPNGSPNRGFQYCNTNFVLLAKVIEVVTNQSYPDYMRDNVFRPLGMYHTFVCSKENIGSCPGSYTAGNRPYTIENFDAIYGDKNIYSTARDLLIWDKALYSGRFIKKETADMAYQPMSNEKASVHNYGFGWRLINKDGVNVVYHTGWWHGNSNIFTRIVQDTTTVIILSNKYNSNVFRSKNTAMAFAKDILGKPKGSDVALTDAEDEVEGGGKQ